MFCFLTKLAGIDAPAASAGKNIKIITMKVWILQTKKMKVRILKSKNEGPDPNITKMTVWILKS